MKEPFSSQKTSHGVNMVFRGAFAIVRPVVLLLDAKGGRRGGREIKESEKEKKRRR